jgi:hypothetical protein
MAVQLFLAIRNGKPLVNLSRRATSCVMEFDLHGESSLSATVRMPRLPEQFRYYDREAGLDLVLTDMGREVWRGRLEEPTVASDGLRLVAYGTWRALSDILHTALWSTTSFSGWEVLGPESRADNVPGAFEFTSNGRLFITVKKNASVGSSPLVVARLGYVLPHRSSQLITNIAFDYDVTLPNGNWQVGVQSFDAPAPITSAIWTYLHTLWFQNGSGSGSICESLPTPANALAYYLFRNLSPNAVYGGETDTDFLAISNLRITTTPLAVDTTLSANASLGATSITLASATEAAKVRVGMALYIGNATTPERVTVNSVAGTTIGITPLAAAKVLGNTVRAQAVRSTDIAAGLIAEMNSANPDFVRATARLLASTADYSDETYLDTPPAKILDALAFAENRVAIASNGTVGFRDKTDSRYANTWYVDATDLEVGRLLDSVRNRIYGIYSDTNDRTLRQDKTAAVNNRTSSQRRYGVIREGSLGVSTTSDAIAAQQVALRLSDAADPAPKVQVDFDRLRTRSGQRVRPTQVRGGDLLVIRNLSRSLAANIDQIATFRIARYSLDVMTLKPTVEAEVPADTLERLLAQPTSPEFDAPIGQRNAWEKPIRFTITPVPK